MIHRNRIKYIAFPAIVILGLGVVDAQAQVTSEHLVNIHNLTTTSISALVSPQTGSLVFNTDSNKLFVYNGTQWVSTSSVDTSSLSARILTNRQAIIDTASNLRTTINQRLRITDTATMLTNYINTATNGLTKSGKSVKLGGSLTEATTLTTTGTNTLSIAGLQSGLATDSLLVINPSNGLLRRISPGRILGGSTTAWSTSGNAGTTAGTNFIGTTDNIDLVFKINSVESGRLSLYQLSATYGYNSVAGYKSTAMGYGANTGPSGSPSTEATAFGHNAQAASYRGTAIGSDASTSGNNALALGQSSTAAYQATAIGSGASATGSNSTAIGYGATTSQANAMVLGTSGVSVGIGTSTPQNVLHVNASANPLRLEGLVSGNVSDSLLTVNASGVVRRLSPNAYMGSVVMYSDTAAMLSNYINSATNGLTKSGSNIKLGGSLSEATTITTTGTNTLSIAGLQSGSTNDSVVMVTSGNVLRRINSASVAKEPWNVVGTSTQATLNTQNIYTQGHVSISKTTNASTLEVGGAIVADSTVSAPNFASTVQSLSSGGTITWNMASGASASVTLTSNATLNITNVKPGMYGLIIVRQDATGGRSLTLSGTRRVINGGGGSVSLTQTGNAYDILTFFYDGTTYWWTIGNNYN